MCISCDHKSRQCCVACAVCEGWDAGVTERFRSAGIEMCCIPSSLLVSKLTPWYCHKANWHKPACQAQQSQTCQRLQQSIYGCNSLRLSAFSFQTEPSSKNSFFQIGTVALSSSIAQ